MRIFATTVMLALLTAPACAGPADQDPVTLLCSGTLILPEDEPHVSDVDDIRLVLLANAVEVSGAEDMSGIYAIDHARSNYDQTRFHKGSLRGSLSRSSGAMMVYSCQGEDCSDYDRMISATCVMPSSSEGEVDPTSWVITELYWSDAHSGRINGNRFRLSNINAPETGSVGAAVGPAQCQKERERGFAAKEFVVELTRVADLRISAFYGYDNMPEPRLLIDLTADGEDVGNAGISAGFLQPWPHDGNKALAPKPDWCD